MAKVVMLPSLLQAIQAIGKMSTNFNQENVFLVNRIFYISTSVSHGACFRLLVRFFFFSFFLSCLKD